MLKLEWLSAIDEERTEALITGNFVTNVLDSQKDNILIKDMLIARNKLSEELQIHLYSGSQDFTGIEKYMYYGTKKWESIIGTAS
jgi:hypothetical protein